MPEWTDRAGVTEAAGTVEMTGATGAVGATGTAGMAGTAGTAGATGATGAQRIQVVSGDEIFVRAVSLLLEGAGYGPIVRSTRKSGFFDRAVVDLDFVQSPRLGDCCLTVSLSPAAGADLTRPFLVERLLERAAQIFGGSKTPATSGGRARIGVPAGDGLAGDIPADPGAVDPAGRIGTAGVAGVAGTTGASPPPGGGIPALTVPPGTGESAGAGETAPPSGIPGGAGAFGDPSGRNAGIAGRTGSTESAENAWNAGNGGENGASGEGAGRPDGGILQNPSEPSVQPAQPAQPARPGRAEPAGSDGPPSLPVPVDSGVILDGRLIPLSAKERALYALLLSRRGRPVSREEILCAIFPGAGGNEAEVYVSYLRAKLDYAVGRRIIRTVRGKGYVID